MRYNNTHNDYRVKQTQEKIISAKTMQEIVKRQEIAALIKARDKIEDYQNDVFTIIEDHGLKNEDNDKKLKTALQVLEYIIPKKKSSEISIVTRKLEDIISESIDEAEVVENENNENEQKE